ncbi:DUF4160 domain-containing protein [Stieleria sp. ICT_E10.1]|uniref:DUF4160 domain-containing protein n=1 Tax=Stieleria sedimenti TaxID=2976331 RepID=UPI00217F7DEC|nr:DUF4160 domain-containing protein [Stieleria sedimenti]MCS7471474.1 DUF4160 domain-containing protein [Stieleria sedimenti]
MPRLSEFYGIAVYMYFADHNPPHFHAIYGSSEAAIAIETGEILAGNLPRRARKLIVEWIELHRDELLDDWRRATNGETLIPIPPLD